MDSPDGSGGPSRPRTRISVLDACLLGIGIVGVSLSAPLTLVAMVPPLALAMWRNVFGTLLLAPLALVRNRAELRGMDRATVLRCVVAGLFLAGHFGTWIPSVTLTSVATSVALVSTTPIWIALYLQLTGRRLPRRVWLGLSLAVVGTVIVAGVDLTLSTTAVLGDLLALAGAVLVAGYMIVGARVRETVGTTAYAVVCYGTCSVVLLVVCLVGGVRLAGYPAASWLVLLAITLCAQIAGHTVFNRVVATVGPTVVSLAALIEVPGSALFAFLLVGQAPPPLVLPGLLVVLAGIALVVGQVTSRE